MNIDERRQYVYDLAVEELKDENSFIEACEELDSYNGFLGDDKIYNMEDFDDLMSGKSPLEIAQEIEGNNFSTDDDYFQFTMYGVESVNDKYDAYSSYYGVEEVLDNLIDNYSRIYFSNSSLKELVEVLAEDNFGFDEDDEIETDEEFKERIDDI